MMNHSQAIETKLPMRYVLGDLMPADRDEFEEHLADCSNCMNEVWMATTFAANAKEVFRTGTGMHAEQPRLAWLRRPFPALAFSAALNVALAACLGYGTLRIFPSMRSQIAELNQPAAIDVVPVRAVERDASASPQVVKAPGPAIVLSFDLPRRYGRYVYSIADASGGVVMSGAVESAGTDSLNLRIPTGRLSPGAYRTTVAGITGNRREDLGTCLLQVGPR
jgi:hypothetical protein